VEGYEPEFDVKIYARVWRILGLIALLILLGAILNKIFYRGFDSFSRGLYVEEVAGKPVSGLWYPLKADGRWFSGLTPLDRALYEAVYANDSEQVRRLIARGAHADLHLAVDQPSLGFTLLSMAVDRSTPEMVALLIDAGARVNALVDVMIHLKRPYFEQEQNRNVRCHTALALAVKLNKPEMVRLLVARGADVSLTDMFGFWTPLEIALRAGKRDEIVQILRDAGASETVRRLPALLQW